MDFVSRALRVLHGAGIRIALDDFGTGYSSLSHLRDFPVSTVKIDRSFTSKVTDEPEVAAIVTAIIDLAASLGMDTVAEGIETQAHSTLLKRAGCRYGHGYLFIRAVPATHAAPAAFQSQSLIHVRGSTDLVAQASRGASLRGPLPPSKDPRPTTSPTRFFDLPTLTICSGHSTGDPFVPDGFHARR
jgi:predicted signal transduction protein with EAL and GGDEF domain